MTARSWTTIDWIALAAVTVVAAGLRLFGMTHPTVMVFDESYYARDACWYVLGDAGCGFPLPYREVHPPLAKWLIGWGIETMGYSPLGWRIAPVVAGTLTILLLYLLARRILRSTTGAVVASGLLAIDFLHFIHSRLAMLDVFVPLFGVAALLLCTYDRDQVLQQAGALKDRSDGMLAHPWRIAAGAAAGAAMASKWSALPLLIAAILLTFCWELSARQADGKGHALGRVLREEGFSLAIWLMVLPLLVYSATYAGRLPGTLATWPWAEGAWVRSLAEQQLYMLRFHSRISITHPLLSPPWSWVVWRQPIFYFAAFEETGYRLIVGFGSPFAWWIALAAIIYVAARVLRHWSVGAPEMTILIGFMFTYGFWLVFAGAHQPFFLFYILPTLPFMYLALASLVGDLGGARRRGVTTVAVALWAALTVALFVFVHPWLTAAHVPYDSWRPLRPSPHDCRIFQDFVWPSTEIPRSC